MVAAMPSRWDMPSENPLMRFFATELMPVISSTSSTRLAGMPLLCASARR
jgi:hypothetical protein